MGETDRADRRAGWRDELYRIIFEHDTPGGKWFDVVLLVVIVASVLAVMLESVEEVRRTHGAFLRAAEWVFTGLFTIEYLLRIVSAGRALRYLVSFFGIVDLLAVIPTYISVLVPGAQSLLVIRALRLLRVFRILRLSSFLDEARTLTRALRSSLRKITVFIVTVFILVVIMGSVMYMLEGAASGFTSIPRSIYWAIVTMTTVGYGDIAPVTVPGQFVAAVLMILGYGIIAVPTGIVSVELVGAGRQPVRMLCCASCGAGEHDRDASFCKHCGGALDE